MVLQKPACSLFYQGECLANLVNAFLFVKRARQEETRHTVFLLRKEDEILADPHGTSEEKELKYQNQSCQDIWKMTWQGTSLLCPEKLDGAKQKFRKVQLLRRMESDYKDTRFFNLTEDLCDADTLSIVCLLSVSNFFFLAF